MDTILRVPVTVKSRFWPLLISYDPLVFPKKTYHEYRTVVRQSGFATSCDDKGVLGES